eukprot:c29579_g1_i1 orf=75-347(+)
MWLHARTRTQNATNSTYLHQTALLVNTGFNIAVLCYATTISAAMRVLRHPSSICMHVGYHSSSIPMTIISTFIVWQCHHLGMLNIVQDHA